MEEELNENDVEDRLYAMLHHVDETQSNVVEHGNVNVSPRVVEAGSVRRYWRDPPIHHRYNNTLHKVNNLLKKVNAPKGNINKPTLDGKNKFKQEQHSGQELSQTSVDLTALLSTPPQNLHKSIEILDHDDQVIQVLQLESSDEDEVIEVALPPKPTITIESSDEDEPQVKGVVTPVPIVKDTIEPTAEKVSTDRDVSSSPVPSIVSSVSDDFIRGDCIALNISSRSSDNHTFDFGLHGSDLLGQDIPSKKKKSKKNKETTITPVSSISTPTKPSLTPTIAHQLTQTDDCFATPKSKYKNKRQKKSCSVNAKIVPYPDVFDSDSKYSVMDTNKKQQSYSVNEKSVPSLDVYESDSSQPDSINSINISKQSNSNSDKTHDITRDVTFEADQLTSNIPITSKTKEPEQVQNESVIDLTDISDNGTVHDTIQDNLVMANVTGFQECHDYGDQGNDTSHSGKFGSTKIPAILNEDLDFDNLKGNRVCSRRKYSLTSLRAEMEKFYNESWGGEDFNHREIQKSMSRDKNLWIIDPKDRMPSFSKRKVTCNFCNRFGHRDDRCRARPPVCHMCGTTGHYETRCPDKICLNCGSPNQMYSSQCRSCCWWRRAQCAECGQRGHPPQHCPDLWRRYHSTVALVAPLAAGGGAGKLACSGCARRGHLVHECRSAVPFSALPLYSPFVFSYRPVYGGAADPPARSCHDALPQKRRSDSPIPRDAVATKKPNSSGSETLEAPRESPDVNETQRKTSASEVSDAGEEPCSQPRVTEPEDPRAAESIPSASSNHDQRGRMIQDNQVSDTSEAVAAARLYLPEHALRRLALQGGRAWLHGAAQRLRVAVETVDGNSFITIEGTVSAQEAFQLELREWTRINEEKTTHLDESSRDADLCELSENIPKNRFNLLRKITKALASLKDDIGDPKSIYKELTYLQNRHKRLLNCKVISPKQLHNTRNDMNSALKKLNMVLLGQAGLADGSKHVLELSSLREKLCNLRQKHISPEVRQQVGHHYHPVFSASPRDDYCELVNKYYVTNHRLNSSKKKKIAKASNVSPKHADKIINSIPPAAKNPLADQINNKEYMLNKTRGKLSFFHRRLVQYKPTDTVSKKTRTELMRKLHTQISSLSNATCLSSKTIKKTRKIQEQARRFLQNQ